MKRLYIINFCVIFAFFLSGITNVSAQTINRYWKDGQIYFKVRDNVILDLEYYKGYVSNKRLSFITDEMAKVYRIENITEPFKDCSSEALRRTFKVEFSNIKGVHSFLRELNSIYEIEYAEPGALYYSSAVKPNDNYYDKKAKGENFNLLWHLDLIRAGEAWELCEGSEDIKVAVLDNAIWTDHPDLKNKIHLQKDFADNKESSNPPIEEYTWSHGTHCAGLIGAETNNEVGIASVGNKIKLIAVKLAYDDSEGDGMANGFEAIVWAVDNGANVISMSWGGPVTFQTMQNVVNYAYNKGCVLLAATGNNGDGGESEVIPGTPVNPITYPAGLTHVIAVGSCDNDDKKSGFSNYGTWIDLLSPGGFAKQPVFMGVGGYSILSTTYNDCGEGFDVLAGKTGGAKKYGVEGKYDIMPGTSMATPVCAGLAGLVLSANKNLTPEKLLEVLKSSCKNVDAQNPQIKDSIGAGRIDAFAAVTKAISEITPLVAKFESSDIVASVGGTLDFTDKSFGTPSSWSWEFEGGTPAQSNIQNPVNIRYDNEGLYQVKLTVSDGTNTNTEIKEAFITVGKNPKAPKSAWVEQNVKFEKSLLGVHQIDIIDQNVAWATSLDLYSEKTTNEFSITTDAGENWIPKNFNLPDGYSYVYLSSISVSKAWICAMKDGASPKGAIFATTDSGSTWTRQGINTFSKEGSQPRFIKMFNENDGVCIGDAVNGTFEIYNTQDGGASWTANPNGINAGSDGNLAYGTKVSLDNSIWFTTSDGKIHRSTDKGVSWTVLSAPGKIVSSLSFADAQNAVAISYKLSESMMGMITETDWKLSKTTNGGQDWVVINEDKSYLTDVCAVPGALGLLIGTNVSYDMSKCRSAYSEDWGQTWTELDDSIFYTCVVMLNKNVGFAGGVNESSILGGVYKWKPLAPTSIQNSEAGNDIKIYPNPAKNLINVENCENSKYQIIDSRGRLVDEGNINNTIETINISKIADGHLLIRIIRGESSSTFKFTKTQ